MSSLSRSVSKLAVALTLSISFSAFADGKDLTLGDALGRFDHSPRVQRAESMSEEASWKKVESYSGFLPTVTAQASRLLNKKYMLVDINLGGNPASIPQIIPDTTYGLGLQWTLFDGFANIDRYRAAKSFESASRKDLDWTKFQGSRDVVLLYYRALAAQTLRDVARQNLKTLEDHLNDVKLFKSSGVGTKFDVLRVEVQTSDARSELLSATDNVAVTLSRLGEALGEDMTDTVLKGQLPVLNPDLAAQASYSEGSRADMEAMRARVEGLERGSTAAAKFWVPRIGLGAQYQKYNNRNDSLGGDDFRDNYSVALNLSWNLFDGAASYSRDRQAVEQKVQAEKSLILAQAKSKNDFEFWRRRYLYYASVYQSKLGDVDKSTESVRLAKEGRRVGTRTNTDLLDAELELFRARAGVVNSQIGSVEALINLEVSSGRPLFKFE